MLEISAVEKIFDLTSKFSEERKKLLIKSPFHFNVIDEVGANENSHSRIIGKLLTYKENNSFVNLISFYKYIGLELAPKSPRILVEKDRIDITIRDRDYVVIIENKIHNAKDQDEQISNYVKKIKNKNYSISQIYVLYLTKWGYKKPTDTSLPIELKLELGDRYFEINFRQHILAWIEEILLNCRQKDIDLIYALGQYIDHLKGLLNLRTKFSFMNKELNKLIAKEISLSDNFKENDAIVSKKIDEFNECLSHLNSIRIDIRNKLRKELLEKLFNKLNEYEIGWNCVNRIYDNREIIDANSEFFGFRNENYKYEDTNLFFSIEIQKWKIFLCGIFCTDMNQRELVRQEFQKVGIELISNKNGWLHLDLGKYNYKDKKPAYFVYDDEWNKYYSKDMEGMVNMFYQEIIKAFESWKKISKKRGDNNG
jgi:hypothetical protein